MKVKLIKLDVKRWVEFPIGTIYIDLKEDIRDVKPESYQALCMELIRE